MTAEIDILNSTLMFDSGVYVSRLDSQMTLTNVKKQLCVVMPFPTGSDLGIECSFIVPSNYSSTPVFVIKGVIDGTPANTLAFAAQQLSRADSEAVDTAYEAEDAASNNTWTGYADEDEYVETITITPSSAYVAGDEVYVKFYRDDSVDTTTFDFLLTHLLFQYTEV